MAEDERIAALEEVAADENEYSGWVALAQGALDVLEERDNRVAELEAALRRVIEESGTSQLQYKIAEAALKGDEAK